VIAFRCAREGFETAATQLLGGFDGRDRREVHVYAVDTRPQQLLVSMHEQLHHELHWSTGWGLVAAMAGLLSEAGVDTERLRPVAAAANATCRRVHEVFATTIAASALGVKEAELLLTGNSEYLAHLQAGLHVAGSSSQWPWQFRESACQMLLRTLMQPAELAEVANRGLESTRVRDVAAISRQPDHRLAQVIDEAGSWWDDVFRDLIAQYPSRGGDRGGAWGRRLPEDAEAMDELKRWEESVLIPALQEVATARLRRLGFAVADQAEYLEMAQALSNSFTRLAPADWHTELLIGSRALSDEPLGAEREVLVLHPAPARIEAYESDDLARHATTFLFEPPQGPRHVLAAWLSTRTLARQFAEQISSHATDSPLLVLAGRPRRDESGGRMAPLAFLREDVTPTQLAAMFPSLPTIVLTTLTVTAERAWQPLVLELDEAFVLIDLPLRLQVGAWLEGEFTVRFRVIELNTTAAVNLVVFHLDELPTLWFLSYRTDAGFGELAQLLDRHGELQSGLEIPADTLAFIGTATSWLLAAWWRIEEVGSDEF
jgi:hypothetical protein